jgi:hypothetical protein
MQRRSVVPFLALAVIFANCVIVPQIQADPVDESRRLLEKGLTIYELDQEIFRLIRQEEAVRQRVEATELEIEKQDLLLAEQKRQAAEILRAYYMGERTALIYLLFSADSWMKMLAVWDFMQIVLERDLRVLAGYQAARQTLAQMHDELLAVQEELAQIKAEYVRQRERLLKLQEELDRQLAASENSAEIRGQIEALTEEWSERGLPLFRTYFQALADTMSQLPDILAGGGEHLTGRGKQVVFQLSDEELNAFLRSKNDLFYDFSFTFADGQIIAQGKKEQIEVTLAGHYTLENEPENVIRFHVDSLTYNGYNLPDTTIQALENEFDLSFYPQKIAGFLEATAVEMEDSRLVVTLRATNQLFGSLISEWLR